jgi:hypothetical protein
MTVTDQKWDGNKLVACTMDGVQVVLCDKTEHTASTWFSMLGRLGGGALVLGSFFPGVGHVVGGVAGVVSQFWNDVDVTGYYDKATCCASAVHRHSRASVARGKALCVQAT